MRPFVPFLALLLFAAFAPAASAAAGYAERELSVWSALIDHGLDPDTRLLVLADETSGDPARIGRDLATTQQLVKQLEVPPSAFADWQRRNAQRDPIEATLDLKVSYQVLDSKTRKQLFDGAAPASGWEHFFQRYPGAPGIVRISHVGFDDTLSHALVYIEHECGADCGAGHLFHLVQKSGGSWEVVGGVTVWMVK